MSSKYGHCVFDVFTPEHTWIVEGNLVNCYGQNLTLLAIGESHITPIKGEPIEDSEISSKELEFN